MFETIKKNREFKKNTKLLLAERFGVDEDGRGIIEIGAENYNDIFSYYSLNGSNVLDGEFNSFLETKADVIPMKYDLTLNFHINEPDEIKEQEIKFAVKENYEREIHAINRKMHNNSLFSLTMLLIGIAFFIGYILFQEIEFTFINKVMRDILEVILDIATWVFFWETVDSFYLERRHLKLERLKYFRLMKSKIIISTFKLRTFSKKNKTPETPIKKKSPTFKKFEKTS